MPQVRGPSDKRKARGRKSPGLTYPHHTEKRYYMHFLEWLYDGPRDDMIAVSQFRPYKTTRAFDTAAAAMEYAEELDGRGAEGVYFRLATLPAGWTPQTPGGRGTAAESAWSYAIMADMDLNGPGHVSTLYPDTDEDLTRLIEKAGLPEPSAWINSGGGRYPIWKLADRVDAAAMAPVSAAWHAHMIGWAKHLGWKLDNTSDVARVYRMPGTHNRKAERNGDHVLCRVTSMDGPVYPFDALTAVLEAAETPTAEPAKPRESAPGAASLFGSPSEVRAPAAMERRKTAFTDEEGQLDLSRRVRELQEELYPGNVYRAISAFTLACLHFQSFPWMSRDVIGQQVLAAAEPLGWTELDAADWDKIDRTIERWRDGLVEDAWVATRVPDVAPADAVDALIAEMLTADQMMDRPTPQYLIKGLLNLDSESWIIGEPGCKKSFVVLDQAIHVVRGLDWRGHKVTQGPVVMIVAEGAGGASTRIKAWQQEYGPIGTGLYMLPRPVQASNAGAWQVLADACKRLGAVMVVLDTQARVTVGLKENDATDMGIYTHAVSLLREATQACVLTVHHTGRNGGDARGSSAIDGAQGTELKVTKDGPLVGALVTEKQKDMAEGPDVPLAFKSVEVGVDEDGDPVTSLVLVPQNAFLDAAGGQKGAQWQEVAPSVVEQILAVLKDHGGARGLTQAEVKATVIERFHGNNKNALDRRTWHSSWTRTCDREEVVMDAGRALVDPLYESDMS